MTIPEQAEVLVEIAKIVNHLSGKDSLTRMTGDQLSYTQVRLSAMKASIVDLKQQAEAEMYQAEIEKDRAKGQAYEKYKKSDGVTAAADMKNMDENYIEKRDEYAVATIEYNKLKSIVSDTHDVLESIKSRVIDLGGARKDER